MYLFGASGHAKVIIDILDHQNIVVKGFFDDDPAKKSLCNIPVIGITNDHKPVHNPCIISIGDNNIRKNVAMKVKAEYQTAIHPNTAIAKTVSIGAGTVVMAGVIMNPDTIIGEHCIINTSASIDHDCQIGDFVHIAPNCTICGGITIAEGAFIGAGAVVVPNIRIGKWSTVGAGAVITKNVPDYAVVVGNKGRIIRYNHSQ